MLCKSGGKQEQFSVFCSRKANRTMFSKMALKQNNVLFERGFGEYMTVWGFLREYMAVKKPE